MPQKYISSKQDSEIKPYILCLGNISKDFTINNMKKKKGLKGSVKVFQLIIMLLILAIFEIFVDI